MTRSEEELRVGTERSRAGRVRLRKYVVTEQVTKTVPVSHEEVRIEREPITDENVDAATAGPEISAEEHEVVLHAERPVVDKRGGREGARPARHRDRRGRARGLRGGPQRADRDRRRGRRTVAVSTTSGQQAGATRRRRADYAPVGTNGKTGLFATVKRTVTEFSEDNMTDWAAALTYYGLLSLFPALIALVSIVGLVGDPATTTKR